MTRSETQKFTEHQQCAEGLLAYVRGVKKNGGTVEGYKSAVNVHLDAMCRLMEPEKQNVT